MNAHNLNEDSIQVINIDIQDTVSSIVDNKLEYNPSAQGPSFADLFSDVPTLDREVTSGGDNNALTNQALKTSFQETTVTTQKVIQNESNATTDIPSITSSLNQHTDHVIDSPSAKCSLEEKHESSSPEIVTLSKLENIAVKQNTDDDGLQTTVLIRSAVTVQSGANQLTTVTSQCQQILSHDSAVKDTTHLEDAADVSNIDLSELIQSQNATAKKKDTDDFDDFDDEFDFTSTNKPAKEKVEPTNVPVKPTPAINPEKTDVVPETSESSQKPAVVLTNATHGNNQLTQTNNIPVPTVASIPEPVASAREEQETDKEDEWAHVQNITPSFGDTSAAKAVHAESSKIINYLEALDNFLQTDLKQYKNQIISTVPRSGFKKLTHALFGPPKLKNAQADQRDQYLCMTHYQFDNSDANHGRMLQTINKRLTGSKFDCPRYGSHWEHIGFQGNDPSTDLRGCGMLGLLQLVYVTTTPKLLSLTRDMYRLSLHETQNFPFCIMAINITRMTVQALREECLNKEIKKHDDLLAYMMDYYTATFYHLYSIWKSQHKTIADTGFVLRDVEAYIKKHHVRLIADLETRLSTRNAELVNEAAPAGALDFTQFDDD